MWSVQFLTKTSHVITKIIHKDFVVSIDTCTLLVVSFYLNNKRFVHFINFKCILKFAFPRELLLSGSLCIQPQKLNYRKSNVAWSS
jgi:hypothetical protein